MNVFLAVVDAGSLSAASRRLGMPLATVSRKLGELETHLGTRLLKRSTRKLALTDPGVAYERACRRILDDIVGAERAAAGEYDAPRGELAITAPLAFGRLHVLPLVTGFLHAHPEVDVRLALGDRIAHLLDEHVDVALRIGPLPDSRLSAIGLGGIRRVVCASPAWLKTHGTPRAPAELAAHRCIAFDLLSSDTWRFEGAGSAIEVPLRPRLVVNTAEAAIDAAIAGLGVTRVLSYQAEAACRAKQLRIVLQEFEPAPVPVSLVFDARQRVASKLRAFLDYAAPRLRERIAAIP